MIEVWTDGSGTIADGPVCIGVAIFVDDELTIEASEYVGEGTNNVAELRAIRRGLYLVETVWGFHEPVTVFSDSEYALGAIQKLHWNIRENELLVRKLRQQVAPFSDLQWTHVSGHSGIYGNELADWLASHARMRYFTRLNQIVPKSSLSKLKRRPEEKAKVPLPTARTVIPRKPRAPRENLPF